MSGEPITKEQVKLYMSSRTKHSQTTAVVTAAKAGISERSIRRIESGYTQQANLLEPTKLAAGTKNLCNIDIKGDY